MQKLSLSRAEDIENGNVGSTGWVTNYSSIMKLLIGGQIETRHSKLLITIQAFQKLISLPMVSAFHYIDLDLVNKMTDRLK